MYLHTAGLAQVPQTSSIHRLARATELAAQFTSSGPIEDAGETFVAAVVSDHADTAYPVYRTNEKVETAASAVFNLVTGSMAVWFRRPIMIEGSRDMSQPDYLFRMRDRQLLPVEQWTGNQKQQTVV